MQEEKSDSILRICLLNLYPSRRPAVAPGPPLWGRAERPALHARRPPGLTCPSASPAAALPPRPPVTCGGGVRRRLPPRLSCFVITPLGPPLSHGLKRRLCAGNSRSPICSRDLPGSAFATQLPSEVPRAFRTHTLARQAHAACKHPVCTEATRLLQPRRRNPSRPRPLRVSHVLRPSFGQSSHLYLQNTCKMQPLLTPAVSLAHTAIICPRFYVRVPLAKNNERTTNDP